MPTRIEGEEKQVDPLFKRKLYHAWTDQFGLDPLNLPKDFSLSWFQKQGLLRGLTIDAKGDTEKAVGSIGRWVDQTKKVEESMEGQFEDATDLMIKDAAREPLLNHQEEIALSVKKELAEQAVKRLNRGVDFEVGEREFLERVRDEGQEAIKILFAANLRLVISIAKRYQNRGISMGDLIQEGSVGLGKGIEKFDWRRGHKFSTYATWWIEQKVTSAIRNKARVIRLPVHMQENLDKIHRVQNMLQQTGEEPTLERISQELGIPIKKIETYLKASGHTTSLDAQVGEDEDSELYDFIKDETNDPDQDLDAGGDIIDTQIIKKIIKCKLTEREIFILEKRGVASQEEHTLDEIAKMLGLSRERIRQLENGAKDKLRGSLTKVWRGFNEDHESLTSLESKDPEALFLGGKERGKLSTFERAIFSLPRDEALVVYRRLFWELDFNEIALTLAVRRGQFVKGSEVAVVFEAGRFQLWENLGKMTRSNPEAFSNGNLKSFPDIDVNRLRLLYNRNKDFIGSDSGQIFEHFFGLSGIPELFLSPIKIAGYLNLRKRDIAIEVIKVVRKLEELDKRYTI